MAFGFHNFQELECNSLNPATPLLHFLSGHFDPHILNRTTYSRRPRKHHHLRVTSSISSSSSITLLSKLTSSIRFPLTLPLSLSSFLSK